MWRLCREPRRVQAVLRGFEFLVTHSAAMRDEYLRHGFHPARVAKIPFWVASTGPAAAGPRRLAGAGPVRLLFLGRFEEVKGGALLLQALRPLVERLRREVWLTMAGDGPQRTAWEREAARLQALEPRLRITFPGWLAAAPRDAALAETDLLVFPSVWPEPFGMTGLEAGSHGAPTVGFDVGGVREWLKDGINGRVAPGPVPHPEALATAMIEVLQDTERYARFSRGALELAEAFDERTHLDALENMLQRTRRREGSRTPPPLPGDSAAAAQGFS